MDSDRELTADDDTRELERAIVPVEPDEIEEDEGEETGEAEANLSRPRTKTNDKRWL